MRRWRRRRSGQFLIIYRSKAREEGLVREMGDFFKAPSINGVVIPYDAGISELKKGLDAPMGDYVVCLRALAWKGDSRSFSIRNFLSRAFGREEHPTFEAYEAFLESRCLIIEKTEGKMAEDDFWIRIER